MLSSGAVAAATRRPADAASTAVSPHAAPQSAAPTALPPHRVGSFQPGSHDAGPQNSGPQNSGPQNPGPQNPGPQNPGQWYAGVPDAAPHPYPGAPYPGSPYPGAPYAGAPYAASTYAAPHRPPSQAAKGGLAVGAVVYLLAVLTTPVGGGIIFSVLGTTVFGTLVIVRVRPPSWHPLPTVIGSVIGVFLGALVIVGIMAGITGLDGNDNYNVACSVLMTVFALSIYGLWAWTLGRPRR